jgi:hypothetical protein
MTVTFRSHGLINNPTGTLTTSDTLPVTVSLQVAIEPNRVNGLAFHRQRGFVHNTPEESEKGHLTEKVQVHNRATYPAA